MRNPKLNQPKRERITFQGTNCKEQQPFPMKNVCSTTTTSYTSSLYGLIIFHGRQFACKIQSTITALQFGIIALANRYAAVRANKEMPEIHRKPVEGSVWAGLG